MNQPNEFVCPNCAETVKFEAKTCRFCGQVLNNAVKNGFPEFYTHAMNDLSLEWLIYDYVKHVLPNYGGSLTAPSLIGNLLSSGDLSEYEEYKLVKNAMRSREGELVGGEIGYELPNPTSSYWLDAKPEQRALCLARRYVEVAQDYTKLFGGKDSREDPKNMNFAIAEFGKMIELAESANPPMEDYASHFRQEIQTCSEHLDMLQRNQSTMGGGQAVQQIRSESQSRSTIGSNTAPAPSKKSPGALWLIIAAIAIILIILIF
jgi:hypothetical protein